MSIIKKRIGKDLKIGMDILTNGQAESLEGRNIRVEAIHELYEGCRQTLLHTVNYNHITIMWAGKDHNVIGKYRLTIWENFGEIGQTAVDTCNAIELVSYSCLESDSGIEGLDVESIDLGTVNLEIGVKGYSAYEIWLQLGHEGTEEDFMLWLQEPARTIANEVAKSEEARQTAENLRKENEALRVSAESARVGAEQSRVVAESARESAEAKRQQDTAAAIKNAEKATTAANDAADKANAAANRADEGANNLGIEDYPEFSAEKSYIVGDVVRYSGKLYRFTVAHPAGAWTGTDAEQTSVKEELDRAVALKANVDGYYETMRVGTADNLTPRGEASEEIIMSRTAGGNNAIESGDALIKSIKGNSVVRNQYVRDHKFETLPSSSVWLDYGGDYQVSNGELTVTVTKEYAGIAQKISVIKGHKYLFIFEAKSPNETRLLVPYLWPEYFPEQNIAIATPEFKTCATIQTAVKTGSDSAIGVRAASSAEMGATYTAKNLSMFDLTQMFGTGNEPATPEEFAHRLGYDSIEQVPYIPYNEGEIVSCNAEGIRTTDAEGDTYERKWATTLHEYFPRGLQSVGNVYDEITSTKAVKRIGSVDLGTLVWTLRTSFNGYCYYADVIDKNKKRLECNVIAAGYVSIPENGTDSNIFSKMLDGCIAGFYNLTSSNSWVYIRDDRYTSVEEFIAGVTGKLLYYELATPEEYTYDELNLTERVVPGGTEEAIVPEGVLSTPLKIDVVYPIDTYGTIVNNKKNIGNISQLQTSAKTDLVSAINENNQLAKDSYPTGGYMAELYEAAGARYNEEKGVWVLNGIELTGEEIAEIYRYTSNFGCNQLTPSAYAYTKIRTNFIKEFSYNWRSDILILVRDCFFYTSFEVINLKFNSMSTGCSLLKENGVFGKSKQLHTILGIMTDGRNSNETVTDKYFTFYGCKALKDFKLYGLKVSTPLKDSPLITYNTIKYLIDNAANTGAITITFHPTTYAYIAGTAEPTEEVGGTKDEWMALVTAAQEKQISLVQAE